MNYKPLMIALSKGRILSDALPLLQQAGVESIDDINRSRQLIFKTNNPLIELMILRATDVPAYVAYGAADIGIVGKDVLMEFGSDQLYELLDLNIARCRLMTAVPNEFRPSNDRLRIATKFVKTSVRYFAKKNQQIDVIKLYGSMELAPLVGLADMIVDIVDTGNTLKANGLKPLDLIANISTRLVVNKAAMRIKYKHIQPLVEKLADIVQ